MNYTISKKDYDHTFLELDAMAVIFKFDAFYVIEMKVYANLNYETSCKVESLIAKIEKCSRFYTPESL